MPFVDTPETLTWHATFGRSRAPQIVTVRSGDTPYVGMDFSAILKGPHTVVTSIATPTEVGAKGITFTDAQKGNDGTKCSVKVTGNDGPDDYEVKWTATLTSGTAQTVSATGILRVV